MSTKLLDWIDHAQVALRSQPWAPLIDIEGISGVDILMAPIYSALLNATRVGSAPLREDWRQTASRVRGWRHRIATGARERRARWASASARPTDILFWSRDVTHTETMHRVASALRDRGHRCRVMACRPNVFRGLQPVVPDAVYSGAAWPRTLQTARRDAVRRIRRLARTPEWHLPLPPPEVPPNAAALLRTALLNELPVAVEAIANARAALEAFRPRILVVGNDRTAEGRAGCRVAARHATATATFMHGAVNAKSTVTRHIADRLMLYGELQRKLLADHGVAEEKMVVCGAPHLDDRPRQTGAPHPALRARFGLRSGQAFVLVATSGPGDRISLRHHRLVIEQLPRLARAFPSTPILVKLHPKDREAHYGDAVRSNDRVHVVPAGTAGLPREIFDWLQGCGVVLTGASAVAVEAMLMEVPVITMDFCDEIRGVGFIEAGATAHVTDGDALEAVLRHTLEGAESAGRAAGVERYLEASFFALDGRASARGAEELVQMMTGSVPKVPGNRS